MTARCDACPGPLYDQVHPAGPTPNSFLFLGAGPARTEARTRIPYSGLAGEEFNETYLTVAGLRREDVVVGNTRLCWDGTAKTPTPKACLTCALTHLPKTLDRVKPEVVVLMGAGAQAVSDTRVRLELHRGRPMWTGLLGGRWEGWVWPSYEPALGMRDTPRMAQLMEDFRHLGQWVRGEWKPPEPTSCMKDYALIETVDDLKDYVVGSLFHARFENPPVDTETDGGKPWSVQFSLAPHTGRMVRATNRAVLEELAWWMERWHILLHNSPQDLDTLEKMGLRPGGFDDTMQWAYQLCSLPQGLKPLAYRLLGMEMRSWGEVVWPASVAAVSGWMEDAIGLAESALKETEVTHLKMGVCVQCGKRGKSQPCRHCGGLVVFRRMEYKPGAAQQILRHVLTHTAVTQDDDKPYDPWEALARMKDEGLRGKKAEKWEFEFLEQELGPTPILSIANCDLSEAVDYGCSDADHCGQVATELSKLRNDDCWKVDPNDYDV